MGSVSGAAIVTRQHMVRPGIVSRILRGRHATWTCRNCMSQTESRWLEEVTRLSGAPSNRWRLYTGGRLQLLCSRTSLAPPHLACYSVQLRLWSVSDLASCGTFRAPANLGRLLSLTPGDGARRKTGLGGSTQSHPLTAPCPLLLGRIEARPSQRTWRI